MSDNIETIRLSEDQLKEFRINLQNFIKLLNQKPKSVVKNKAANNSDYVPISTVENSLDELFFGLWETKNFTYQVIGNEVVGSIELTVYHPKTGRPITRVGVGASQIRMEKNADVLDISKKIKTALQMDFPHMKAECVKNAAKSIGKVFGRDLNRDYAELYEPMIKLDTPKQKEEARVKKYIEDAKNEQALEEVEIVQFIKNLPDDHEITILYNNKKTELKKLVD